MYVFGRWAHCVCMSDLSAHRSTLLCTPTCHRDRILTIYMHCTSAGAQRPPATYCQSPSPSRRCCTRPGWLVSCASTAPGRMPHVGCALSGSAGRSGTPDGLVAGMFALMCATLVLLTAVVVACSQGAQCMQGILVRPAGPLGPSSLCTLHDQGSMLAGAQPACIMGG